MSAQTNLLRQQPDAATTKSATLGPVPVPAFSAPAAPPLAATPRVPSLRVIPLQPLSPLRRFAPVPTHAVGVFHEQREYPTASLRPPLHLPRRFARSEA